MVLAEKMESVCVSFINFGWNMQRRVNRLLGVISFFLFLVTNIFQLGHVEACIPRKKLNSTDLHRTFLEHVNEKSLRQVKLEYVYHRDD
jgi:hypothetical protein